MPRNSPASTKANLLTVHQTGGGWQHFWRQFAAVELEQPGSGLQEGYHGREGRASAVLPFSLFLRRNKNR